MSESLFFVPIYQERVWGGRNLENHFGRNLPAAKRIGESWEVSDRPEANSVIASGRWKGMTLRDAITEAPVEIMGPRYSAERPFPILVKWLDCEERLSLQVHPPAAVAERHNGEPKTENWYIAGASKDARLIVGLRRGVTREEFEKALTARRLEDCVHSFPSEAGASILVRSGQIHAIDAGNLILEIQQNSDTTYRVFDWGRTGLDGKPRRLHIEESLESIDFSDFEPAPVSPKNQDMTLAECAEFTIRKFHLPAGRELRFNSGEQPRLVHLVSGSIEIDGQSVQPGANFLILFTSDFRCAATEESVLLVTENFV